MKPVGFRVAIQGCDCNLDRNPGPNLVVTIIPGLRIEIATLIATLVATMFVTTVPGLRIKIETLIATLVVTLIVTLVATRMFQG